MAKGVQAYQLHSEKAAQTPEILDKATMAVEEAQKNVGTLQRFKGDLHSGMTLDAAETKEKSAAIKDTTNTS